MNDSLPSNGQVQGAPRDWLRHYPAEVPASLRYPDMPLGGLLEAAAARFPDRAGCSLFGTTHTYAWMAERARRLASALEDLGAGPGRCVGLLMPNIPEYVLALQATWLTGATALQLSPLLVGEEIGKLLELTGCHIVVTLDLLEGPLLSALSHGPLEHVVVASLAGRMSWWRNFLYRVERMRRNGVHLGKVPGLHPFEELLAKPARALQARIIPEEDVALMAPTGGTTASPKVVMLTHRNLIANAWQLRTWSGGADGTEGILGVLPFFHAYGLTVGLLTGFAKAATVHLWPRFEPRAVLNLLEEQRVELVPAVPAMVRALNRQLARKPRDLSFVRAVISGAAALSRDDRDAFASYGPRSIVEGYGLSEASPVTHVNPFSDHQRPSTIGLPLPDTDARLVDPETGRDATPLGEVGELVVRGPQVMKGYYHNPEATRQALRDGWLFTGDLARRDGDGFFTIVDRKRDIIKTSGFLVYPAEVEEVLCHFPGVSEAAVVGDPDPDRGEAVRALLVTAAEVDLHRLQEYCALHLAHHKRPRKIEIVTELPKNFLGKTLRRKLRETDSQTTPAA